MNRVWNVTAAAVDHVKNALPCISGSNGFADSELPHADDAAVDDDRNTDDRVPFEPPVVTGLATQTADNADVGVLACWKLKQSLDAVAASRKRCRTWWKYKVRDFEEELNFSRHKRNTSSTGSVSTPWVSSGDASTANDEGKGSGVSALVSREHPAVMTFTFYTIHDAGAGAGSNSNSSKRKKPMYTYHRQQEYEVLSSHSLAVLKDEVYCLHEHEPSSSISNTSRDAGPVVQDGFFCIENVFYVDTRLARDDQEADRLMQDWLRTAGDCFSMTGKHTPSHTPLQVRSMQSTLCGDIQDMKLGVNYVYGHIAPHQCEHAVAISDIRSHHPLLDISVPKGGEGLCTGTGTDREVSNQTVAMYPKCTFLTRMQKRKCMVCEVGSGTWLVYGDRLANAVPMLYCNHCYHYLHYSRSTPAPVYGEEGEGLGTLLYDDYTVFPYVHDMA